MEEKSKKDREKDVRDRILKALENMGYKYRTVGGIAQESKLPRAVVVEAIKKDSELTPQIKIAPFKAKNGKVLITTKVKFGKTATAKEKFVDFFASKRAGVDDV